MSSNAERRARFACEVIEAVRKRVGAGFTVIFRFSGSDFMEGGITIEDSVRQAPLFVEAGADVLDVSACEQASTQWQFPSFLFPQGALVPLAEAIKKAVTVPVITVGKIVDPLFAEEVLREGKADFIALGRALIADPEWANKAKEGRFKDIRCCVYCVNCINFAAHPYIWEQGLSCPVNPTNLREKEFALKPTGTPKKVCEDNIEWFGQTIEEETWKVEKQGIKQAKEAGVEFITLPPEELNKVYAVADRTVLEKMAKLDAKGLPGTKVYKEMRLLIKKYSKK
ncbi:hypothetical protein ACFLZG_04820 [Thermodesulfobacteriota bacterium]